MDVKLLFLFDFIKYYKFYSTLNRIPWMYSSKDEKYRNWLEFYSALLLTIYDTYGLMHFVVLSY